MKVLAPDKWNHQYAAHLLAQSGFGATPEQIDIVHTVDYRSVYATVLEKHLAVDSKPILLKPFKPLDFLG